MILVHVGMPRTGSTWLQEKVFPVHPEVHYPKISEFEHIWANRRARKVTVLSNKRLAGPAWGPKGMEARAKLLKHMIPKAEILLVTRSHTSTRESMFRWAVENEAEWSREAYAEKIKKIAWWFHTDVVVDVWRQLFKVHVLEFNDLKADPQGYAGSIWDILGVKHIEVDTARVNASMVGWRFHAARGLNRVKEKLT